MVGAWTAIRQGKLDRKKQPLANVEPKHRILLKLKSKLLAVLLTQTVSNPGAYLKVLCSKLNEVI